MSLLSRAFYRPQEARILTGSSAIPTPYEDAMAIGAAPEGNAMSLGAFYACVTLLADTISSLTVSAYREQDGARITVSPQPVMYAKTPFPGVTWFDWLWMFMESLAIAGNAYGLITARDDTMRPTAIMPIHPDDIQVTIPETTDRMTWPDPEYRIGGKRIPNADIIHIKRYPIAGQAYGMSPIQKAANSVGLGLAAERYGLRYFKDSANPSGLLTTDQDLTPEQVKRNMKQWMQSHQGRRLPAIMSGGLKWEGISITPEESQFLLTRQHQRSDIAMWFRIPPHMIGDTEKSTSWGQGLENQSIGFVTYTLRPWLTCIEQVLTSLLPRGQFAKFNIDGLLRGDVKTRWEAYRMGREAGVYSTNDIREKEDLPPIPDGDGRLQPMNFVPLGTDPAEVQLELAKIKQQNNTAPATGGEGGNP